MKKTLCVLIATFYTLPLLCQDNKCMGSPCKYTVKKGNDTVYHLGSIPIISGDTVYLCETDSFDLQLSVTGTNCFCNSLQWKKDGANIPNASSYSIHVVGTGQYAFDIFCSPNGTVLTFGPVIQVMSCVATGIRKNEHASFRLFPNPTEDRLTVELDDFDNTTVKIYNTLGQCVLAGRFSEKLFQVDISVLANGMYTVFVDNSVARSQQKIIKNTR